MTKLLAILSLVALVLGCAPEKPENPVILMGVDGAEWTVIEALWKDGRLPNLHRLAGRGVTSHLETAYGKSPVIWTTIATGLRPEDHGIEAFFEEVNGERIPVTSTTRRAPALWDMLTQRGRSVAVLGWWASWPAETVDGPVVSDRAARRSLDRRVSPPELEPEIDRRLDRIEAWEDERFYPLRQADLGPAAEQDALIEDLAPEMAAGGYDLLMLYLRQVDLMSHRYWKFWQPEPYADLEPFRSFSAEELERQRDWLPATYERVDRVLGRLVEAAPSANIFVVSDHGFRGADYLRITMDFDALLERLGYLVRDDAGAVDMERSEAFSVDTVPFHPPKRVRLIRREGDGDPDLGTPPEVERRLVRDLARLRFTTGEPVFRVRRAPPGSPYDIEATLLEHGLSRTLLLDGRRLEGLIPSIENISGQHQPDDAGVFLAAGPDIDPGADPTGISIHDIAPTVLYALGLPVGENMVGRAWRRLFTKRFRAAWPTTTVPEYRMPARGGSTSSEVDEELIEELRSLGYLD